MSFHASSTVASPTCLDSSNLGNLASPHPELFAFTSLQHPHQHQHQHHSNFAINALAQSSPVANQQGSMNPSNLNMTSPGADFADLLAEFTLPANALSPADANAMLGNSPGVPPSYVDHHEALVEASPSRGGGGGGHQLQQPRQHRRERSAQELVLHHIGFSLAPSTSTPAAHPSSPNPNHSGGNAMSNSSTEAANAPSQITNVIATMDPAARSQLLNALLALKQQHPQTNTTSASNSPAAASPVASAGVAPSPRHRSPSRMGSSLPSTHENPYSSQRGRSSAPTYTNSPLMTARNPSRSGSSSAQASPMAYYGTGADSNVSTPHAYQSHHRSGSASKTTGNLAAMLPNPPNNYFHQIATSLPPSSMPSPLASPHTSMQQQPSQQLFDASAMQQQHQHVSAQLQAHSAYLAAASQSSQQQMQMQNAFGIPGFEMEQNPLSRNASTSEVQAAIDMLTRVAGSGGVGGGSINGDMNLRGGSSTTGGSYATHPEGDDWAGSNDVSVLPEVRSLTFARLFMFSPLMSPAMTPQSVFTTASSLPPSGSFPPSKNALVTPAEFFSPLGSPAIMPQQFNDDPAAAAIWQAQQLQHRASLQGLVDQTRALGFDTSNLAAIQAVYSPYLGATVPGNATSTTGSPANAGPATASPRLDSNDAGSSTAAGAGRRGAGFKKARPSPLLKPTPDGQLVRRATGKKAAASAAGDRRSASISNGARSTTTSPFLGPSPTSRGGVVTPASNGGRGAAGGGFTGSQRSSPLDDGTTNAISADTPSPVDLSLSSAVAETSTEASPAFAMNGSQLMGPPPLPSSAAPLRRSSIVQSATPVPQQDAIIAAADWLHQAATPATFMNLPNNIAGVSSLSHRSTASTLGETQQPHDSNALLTPPDQGAAGLANAARDSTSPSTNSTGSSGSGPTTSTSSKGKSTKSTLTSSRKIAARPIKASRIAPAPLKPKTALTPSATQIAKVKDLERDLEKEKPAEKRKYKGKEKEKELGVVKTSEMDDDLDACQTSTAMKDDTSGDFNGSTSGPGVGGELRRTSHKAAEQKRRDSLKQCFESLRRILPPIAMNATPDEEKRPGEGNVGGQRSGSVDPENPNRGVSKVALLRRSNEYVGMLHDRIDRRDGAIDALRRRVAELRERLGEEVEEDDDYIDGFELDALDKDEKKAGNVFFCECRHSFRGALVLYSVLTDISIRSCIDENLDDDDEEEDELRPKGKSSAAPKRSGSLLRRKSNAASQADETSCVGKDAKGRPGAGRRSTRNSQGASEHKSMKMDVEAEV
ncbi:BQ2448_2716 [Microbotryum intermedium]|uniref:BQ2448_2716 protein n=1 Tax=Microbotryum intermedium TaxID=269621 RepID=A0A238FIX2_9BASI|nr:BQ2448_2716 [Microbotryum intermedium]